MKTDLNFEDKSTKELLSKLDIEFFLKQNFDKKKYDEIEINEVYSNYKIHKKELKEKSKKNKKQFDFYVEGQIRKMFTGGFLPAIFELDTGRELNIFDFAGIGESWAYFDYWRKYYKRKLKKERIWGYLVKIGSVLAFILTLLKLYDLLIKK